MDVVVLALSKNYAKSQVEAFSKDLYNEETSIIKSEHLPSYVDDVVEYDTRADFPVPGEVGKIYVALDTGLSYRWSGSTYILAGERYFALIAPEYSETAEYRKNDAITYEGELYRCTVVGPISGIPPIGADEWEAINITEWLNEKADITALSTEISRRTSADAALGNRITAEANARSEKDTELASLISAEQTRAINAEVALGNRVDTEKTRAEEAETALGTRITTELAQEEQARNSAISSAINIEVSNRNSAIEAAVDVEAQARDQAISAAISTEAANRDTAISEAIASEVQARNSAISDAITEEVSDRNSAISAAIDVEVVDRNSAISTAIDDEVIARNSAISDAIDAEAAARTQAISDAIAVEENRAIGEEARIEAKVDRLPTYTAVDGTDNIDIEHLPASLLEELKAGDVIVNKVSGISSKYVVSSTNGIDELSLVYTDQENIEEITYTKVNDVWTSTKAVTHVSVLNGVSYEIVSEYMSLPVNGVMYEPVGE